MYETANAALTSARELGLGAEDFRQVGPDRWQEVLRSILERFTVTCNHSQTWLWDDLKLPGVSAQIPDALDRLDAFIAYDTKIWLLLEDWDGTKQHGNYWLFEGLYGAVVRILRNMHGIEYYLIDRRLQWMLVENHHEVLIGVGEPAESFVAGLKASSH